MLKAKKDPTLIGWMESIDLPDWGIRHITAKADTGARRSAIDVKHAVPLDDGRIRFDVVIHRKGEDRVIKVVTKIAHQTRVRSSNGQQHERYFVRTRIRVGKVTKTIELSLTCRKEMNCRMLLGRKALEGSFLVDSAQIFLTRPNFKPRIVDSATK